MIKNFFSRQFLRFIFTGGVAAVVNFSSRFLYDDWVSFSNAVILAYITGMITAFILAKLFVFKDSKQSTSRSALFFILVNIVAVLQTWGISMGLAYYLLPSMGVTFYVKELAHITGIIIPVFTSYIGHKRFSFK